MLKYTERAGLMGEAEDLRKAVHIMHVVPKTANDMMMVSRLQNFEGKISAQGKLLQQGLLLVADVLMPASSVNFSLTSIKLKERQVFLFEQIIIFSDAVGQKTQFSNPNYMYKNHLQVNKMSLIDKDDNLDEGKFVLRSKDPQQEGLAFLCEGLSREDSLEWVSNIRAILDTQLDFLRALQSPIEYQRGQEQLTKEMWAVPSLFVSSLSCQLALQCTLSPSKIQSPKPSPLCPNFLCWPICLFCPLSAALFFLGYPLPLFTVMYICLLFPSTFHSSLTHTPSPVTKSFHSLLSASNFPLLASLLIYFSFLSRKSSAPELFSLWNPSLRKTLSHPSAVHKGKEFLTSKPSSSALCSTNTSKSVRISNKVKERNKPGSAPPAAEYTTDLTPSRRKSPLASMGLTSGEVAMERLLASPSKLPKKSFIDGFKTSLKLKRSDFLADLQPSSSFANSSHSFDGATIKKSSLTNDYLSRVNTCVRRWSESTPRNTKNNNE